MLYYTNSGIIIKLVEIIRSLYVARPIFFIAVLLLKIWGSKSREKRK